MTPDPAIAADSAGGGDPVARTPRGVLEGGPARVEDAESIDPTPGIKKRHAGAGLKGRVIGGGKWTGVSFLCDQGLAFISNIALTHIILSADEFGLMQLLMIIITGLNMFSDVGITPSLIQNKREDPGFYNTAWTMQVGRGFALWLAACVLAYPLSLFGEDWERLGTMLPVAALTCVISGFRSTGWVTANRRLDIRSMAILTATTSAIRIAVQVAVAYALTPTAWSLVVGLLVGQVIITLMSHRMIPEIRNRFHFEREAFGELYRFGKWIFLSTAVTFFAGQIDKFMLAGMVSVSTLGIFAIGQRLAELGPMFTKRLAGWVGFPALSDLYRRDEERFKDRLLHMRKVLAIPINCLLVLLILFGPTLSYIFYHNAKDGMIVSSGWIVQVLCFGSIAGMTNISYGHAYMASGRTKYVLCSVAWQLVTMVAGTLAGYYLAEPLTGGAIDAETGFILGIGACQWFKYLGESYLANRAGFLQVSFDGPMLIGFGTAAYFALMGSQWLAHHVILPGRLPFIH